MNDALYITAITVLCLMLVIGVREFFQVAWQILYAFIIFGAGCCAYFYLLILIMQWVQ